MAIKRKIWNCMFFCCLCLWIVLGVGNRNQVQAQELAAVITFVGGPHSTTSERYYNFPMIYHWGTGGTWEFWYSNDGVNYKLGTSGSVSDRGTDEVMYEINYKCYDLKGVKPNKPTKNGAIAYSSGTTYYVPVTATCNSTPFYFQIWMTFRDGSRDNIYLDKGGYVRDDIQDKVKGYYYKIDSSSTSSFTSGESGVKYKQSSNLTFDVSDAGKWMHVRAVSCSGKVSEVLDIKLTPTEPKKNVILSSDAGIASTTGAGKYLPGQMVTVSASVKEYYDFSGWSGTYSSASQTYTFRMPNQNVTLTASSSRPTYTLTYETMGGSGGPSSQSARNGESVTVASGTPSKTNYSFVEWNTRADGTGTTYSGGNKMQLTADTILYAIWKADTYTIRLHANRPSTASHAVEHISELKTDTGVELKDATKAQIEASGVGNFGFVTSLYYAPNSRVDNYTKARECGVYYIGTIQFRYSITGVSSIQPTNLFEWQVTGATNGLLGCQTIVYDYTTKKYYMAGKNTNTYAYAADYNNYGAASNILFGGHYQKPHGNLNGYYAYSSWVCLGDSYIINTDVKEWIELKNATAEQIEKYTNLPGYAIMSMYVPNRTYYGSSDQQKHYYFDSDYSFKGFDATATNRTLSWAYTGRLGFAAPKYLYQCYQDSAGKYHCNYGFSANDYSNGANQDTTGKMKAGTIVYDWATAGYYMYIGYNRDSFRENRTSNSWAYLGTSYKIAIPNTWDWVSENTATGEGYYQKTFTSLSEVTLPSSATTYTLTGWHTTDSKDTAGENGTSWVTSKDLSGKYYAEGTRVTNVTLTNVSGKVIDLYAPWQNNTYTVSFYPNGGSGSMKTLTYTYDGKTEYLPANTFRKSNSTFTNWQFTTSESGYVTTVADKGAVKNWNAQNHGFVNLYALWKDGEITYNIAFDGNGATSGSMSSLTGITYNKQVTLTKNAFQKTGYTFYGWTTTPISFSTYLANKSDYVVKSDQAIVSCLTNVQGATVTYYALWKPEGTDENGDMITYTIVFRGNGADSGSMDNMSMTYGETKELSENQFERSHFHFVGWSQSYSGPVVYADKASVSNLTRVNHGVVLLYAQWAADKYTIAFDGNGATSGTMQSQEMTYGVTSNLSANNYKKTGYLFAGWNTESDGTGTLYVDKQSVINLLNGNGSKMTLYAQWAPVSTTIHFNGNGADSGSMSDVLMYYERGNNLPANTFVKTGYYFFRWTTKADGSGFFYGDKDIYLNTDPTDGAEITLYAQWKGNPYTVKFDGNGADSGSMDDQSMIYDTEAALAKNQYGKTGYRFDCWNTKADGTGLSYQDEEVVVSLVTEGEIILYAQWIDKDPPQFTDEEGNVITEDEVTYGWTNDDVVFMYHAIDLGTGVELLNLYDEAGNEVQNSATTIYKRTREEGITKYVMTTTDKAGNIATLKITVLIDKTEPAIDNEERYVLQKNGKLTVTFHTQDSGGSGILYFNLYRSDANGENLQTITSADKIDGSNAELTYEFQDDLVSDDMYYSLIAEDIAGNVTKHTFSIQPNTSISGKEWKFDKTTVYDDTQVLSYIQHGDMKTWFEVYLDGYLTEVTYDFDDDLNALGVEDVTHTLTPAETVTDNLEIVLPTTMTYDKIYTVTIKGKRQEREVSMTLYLRYVEMTMKPKRSIRYQNGMAMPKDGGEWIDYEKEAELEKERIKKYRDSLLILPEEYQKKEEATE